MPTTLAPENINKPTPSWMKKIFNGLLYLSGLWAILAPVLTNIPEAVLNSVNQYIVMILPILRFTISFFHYDYSVDDK